MSNRVLVPQANPQAAYLSHRAEIDAAFVRAAESGWYILGAEVAAFEKEFAAYVTCDFGIGVANGTDAVELALRACGVGPGDAVFTVSHTAVATVAAIDRIGATPLFVDVDPLSFTLDPNRLEHAVREADRQGRFRSDRARAVVPVHLYGHPADMPAILEIAGRFDLRVVEDCAQAHGAELHGRRLGSWGDLGAFSFYPTKNLGALGDGGMVVTADEALAGRVRRLRQYGWIDRYVSSERGFNSRLDELQAAVLLVKLKYLDAETERRRAWAARYEALLTGAIQVPAATQHVRHVYHQYVVRTPARDALSRHLAREGIGTAVHYPVPVHLQPAYRGAVRLAGELSNTEALAREVLSLPMYPELTEEQVDRVAHGVIAWSAASVPH